MVLLRIAIDGLRRQRTKDCLLFVRALVLNAKRVIVAIFLMVLV